VKINKLIIDSSDSVTELCQLGIKYPTDKSAYAIHNDNGGHRHAYMAIYDLLFMPMKYKSIRLLEVGILNNMSMKCWRDYFVNATLFGFDNNYDLLSEARKSELKNTYYHEIDVTDERSIKTALLLTGGGFDIIIEDSLHDVKHNFDVSKEAYKYLNCGGYLILEDLCDVTNKEYGDNYEDLYNEYFEPLQKYFHSMTYIISKHKNECSGHLDNSKLLVLCRNDVKD
jgi:hypothetical protein